jgi:hypothetical protein
MANFFSAVILRRSPFFTASLEGWPQARVRPSLETPRKRAAPQDDGGVIHRHTISIAPSGIASNFACAHRGYAC